MDTLTKLEKQNNKYSGAGTINQMYDTQEQKRLNELENAYKQSMSSAQAAADKIPGAYQQKANDMAVQYERNKQNFNNQAAGSGINTGTASQAALAQNSTWQRDYGNLRTAQADAQTEAERGMAELNSQYQSKAASVKAENDFQRYAALLDEYNRQYARDMNEAQILAGFGDFSGYADLYGQEQADNMQLIWQAQNPGLAYNTGRISAEEYKRLTGSYPPGYSPPNSNVGRYYNPSPSPHNPFENVDVEQEVTRLKAAGASKRDVYIYLNDALKWKAITQRDKDVLKNMQVNVSAIK